MNENRLISLIRKVIRLSFQAIDMIIFYIKSLSYKNNPKYKNMWLISERGNEAKDNAYVLFKYIRENHIDMIIFYIKSLSYKNNPKYKNMWLISERGNEAKDNAYVLFKYIRENHPNINIHYLMDKSFEKDYEKIKDLGNIIEYKSEEHKIAFLLCDKAISTHIGFLEPWSYKLYKLLLDRKDKKEFIFLQHGIILHDVSDIYNKGTTKIDLFITSTDKEFEAISSS